MTEEQINMNALKYARENSQPVLYSDDNGDVTSDFDDLVCAYIEGARSIKKEYDSLNKNIQWLRKSLRECAIKLHKARNPWISVEDRLPKESEKHRGSLSDTVFVMTNQNDGTSARYDHATKMWCPAKILRGCITHWMSIPQKLNND